MRHRPAAKPSQGYTKPPLRIPERTAASQPPRADAPRAAKGDPFFKRVCQSLALSDQELMVLTQLPAHELGKGHVAVEDNDAFERILAYVNTRIGVLMGVREEITRKLARERNARLKRRMEVERR